MSRFNWIVCGLSLLLLAGCGGSSGGSSDADTTRQPAPQQPGPQTPEPQLPDPQQPTPQQPGQLSLDMQGESRIEKNGSLTVLLTIDDLNSDDAIYVQTEAENALALYPENALLYPTDGQAKMYLQVQERQMQALSEQLTVKVTASDGRTTERQYLVELAE